MSEVKVGVVCWFDPKKGYGFISCEGDTDLFVHFSDVNSDGFKTLYKDQKVSYEVGTNKRGQPKAVNVNIVKV